MSQMKITILAQFSSKLTAICSKNVRNFCNFEPQFSGGTNQVVIF